MLRRVWLLAALTLPACKSPPKPDAVPKPEVGKDSGKTPGPDTETPTEPPLDGAPLAKSLLPAPLTVAIRPAQWSAFHGASMPLLAKLPDDVEPLRKASSPEAVFGLLATGVFGVPSPEIKGWDTSRPILIALAETDISGVAGATVGQLPLGEGWVPGIRHQVRMPASDPAALLTSLATTFSAKEQPLPALAEGHEGAVAMRFDDWSVVLLPADKAVRIVIFERYVGLAEDKALAHMRGRLDTPIHVTTSAASEVLDDDGALLSAWLRPDRLRPLAVSRGAAEMFLAITTVAPEMKPQLMAAGMDVLMSTDAAMVDEGAEVDETGLTLRADGGALRLRHFTQLSKEGEQAFAAATKAPSPTFATAAPGVWVDLVVRADARALLDAVEPPSFAHPSEGSLEVVELIQEGGAFAQLHLSTRHALGLLRFAELASGPVPFPTDTAPSAVHVVWAGMGKDDLPKIAAALHWPKGHDITGLTTLFKSRPDDPDLASLKVHTTEYEGAPTHVLGFGGLSEKAFAMGTPSPAEPLVDLRADVPALAAAAMADNPEVGAWFSETSQAHFTLRHDPYALSGELAWSPSGGEIETTLPPASNGNNAPKPIGNPANSEAERCVGKSAFAYAWTLEGLVRASPETLKQSVTEGLAEADKAVACAQAEPKSRAAVQGLRRIAVSTALDLLTDATLKESIRKQQCALDQAAPYCDSKAQPSK